MCRRGVLAVALLLTLGASAASAQTIAKVSTATKTASQSGASLVSATQTHAAGNLLVASFFHQPNTTHATSCTNTAGDTWAPTRATAFNASLGGTARTVELWYTATASTAASTPTGTIGAASDIVTCAINSANTFNSIDIYEFSKTSGTWGLVADSSGTAASGATALTTGTLTLTNPSVIVGEFMVSASGGTVTAGTGYTAVNSDGSGFAYSEYHITSSSEAATAADTTAVGYVFIAAAFQASAGGATRGLFQVPSLGGLGIGGSFFRDPLQFIGLAGWAFAVLVACAVATHQTLKAVDQVQAHLTTQREARVQATALDARLKQQMADAQDEAKQRELVKVRRG